MERYGPEKLRIRTLSHSDNLPEITGLLQQPANDSFMVVVFLWKNIGISKHS